MTSQKSLVKPGGNTLTPGPKYQMYVWAFTMPIDIVSASQLSQHLKCFCKKFTFQGEKGESGYEHWQGAFSLKTKEYFAAVKNMMPAATHLEPAKDVFAAFKYCTKVESRICGPYDEHYDFNNIITELRPWQREAEKLALRCKSDRLIHWFYDPNGGAGKTQFCKYMISVHRAEYVGNGAKADIFYAISDNPKMIMINFCRSNEGHVNYEAIEALKDGLCFSSKYESRTKVFDSPLVMIFSNFYPDMEKLTMDRWNVIHL